MWKINSFPPFSLFWGPNIFILTLHNYLHSQHTRRDTRCPIKLWSLWVCCLQCFLHRVCFQCFCLYFSFFFFLCADNAIYVFLIHSANTLYANDDMFEGPLSPSPERVTADNTVPKNTYWSCMVLNLMELCVQQPWLMQCLSSFLSFWSLHQLPTHSTCFICNMIMDIEENEDCIMYKSHITPQSSTLKWILMQPYLPAHLRKAYVTWS